MFKMRFFKTIFFSLTLLLGSFNLLAQSSCEADHTIILIDYEFSPSQLTIAPGETVAFINVEGTHDVNGITNSITGEPFDNPEDFYLNESVGGRKGSKCCIQRSPKASC